MPATHPESRGWNDAVNSAYELGRAKGVELVYRHGSQYGTKTEHENTHGLHTSVLIPEKNCCKKINKLTPSLSAV